MGRYIVEFTAQAKSQLAAIGHSGNQPMMRKLERLLEELSEHPTTGTGQPERLKARPDRWSRRLDKKNRLVYDVKDYIVTVSIVSLLGHYDDK